MNSLLARQIRKFLDKEQLEHPLLTPFLDAINKSYENYEDQFGMLQRAMSISSQELFDANIQLKKEAEEQRSVIASLTETTNLLRSITLQVDKGQKKTKELTGMELANLIEKQAIQISKIEKQREKILKDLEKSNQELSEYAHVVSHDLKSPLRTINTLLSWMKEDFPASIPNKVKEHMLLIDKNLEKMDNLIQGILEYSLIDKKGHLTETIDTNDAVEEVIKMLPNPKEIQIEIANPLPALTIDRYRLKQVFQNLLSNAIASIDKKKGRITIQSETLDTHWKFSISDNGSGIDQKYHSKIFELFQTLHDTKETTGIGLAIVKKIIDYYQGKVWVKSAVGQGTTFYFTLKK